MARRVGVRARGARLRRAGGALRGAFFGFAEGCSNSFLHTRAVHPEQRAAALPKYVLCAGWRGAAAPRQGLRAHVLGSAAARVSRSAARAAWAHQSAAPPAGRRGTCRHRDRRRQLWAEAHK